MIFDSLKEAHEYNVKKRAEEAAKAKKQVTKPVPASKKPVNE